MKIPYLEYFGLVDEPYSTSPNPRYLYISPTHNTALEKTKYIIAAKRGLALCFGAVGTGKTTLARELALRMEDEPEIQFVFITNPNFPTPNQLLRAIVQEFDVGQTSKNYLELLNIFKTYVTTQAVTYAKTLVLIIDEAQTLKPPLIEMLRQLANFETNDSKLLQLVLFAQEELRNTLARPALRNFKSRIVLASTLEHLSVDDLRAMLKFRWEVASGGAQHPFSDNALRAIFEHSAGMPREANILADNALVAAYYQQAPGIDADLVSAVAADRSENLSRLEARR